MITYKEFENVELRSGTLTKVDEFLRAKKLTLKVWVDFGTLQTSNNKTLYLSKRHRQVK